MVRLEDIAHALALMKRFNVAARIPYSVALHSLYVAALLPTELRCVGLPQDAVEAYIGDLASPLKPVRMGSLADHL